MNLPRPLIYLPANSVLILLVVLAGDFNDQNIVDQISSNVSLSDFLEGPF